jgi:hypothetical protein
MTDIAMVKAKIIKPKLSLTNCEVNKEQEIKPQNS